MRRQEVLQHARKMLRRRGYGDQFIGEVLPFYVEGFLAGVRSAKPKAKK